MAGQAQAQLGATDLQIEVAAAVGDRGCCVPPATRSRPTPMPFLVSPALTTIVAGAPSTPATRSSVAWWAATCGSLRTTVLSSARPIETGQLLDAPRLAHEAVAVDHLEQRQRRG